MGTVARIEGWLRAARVKRLADTVEVQRAPLGGGRAEVLHTLPCDVADDQIEPLANELWALLDEEAQSAGRTTKFRLAASTDERVVSTTTVRIVVRGGEADALESDPTSDGLLRQLMRHNEMLVRTLTHGAVQREAATLQLLEVMSNRAIAAEERYQEVTAEHAEVIMARASIEGDNEMRRAQIGALHDVAQKLLPLVSAKLLGPGAPAADVSSVVRAMDGAQLREALKSITPEQMSALLDELPETEAAVVGQLWFSLNETGKGSEQ